jgi:hypothetical protein
VVPGDPPHAAGAPPSPRVVIAAPLYNQAAHVGEALASLLAQTFADFRLVLVDDASSDDTVAVARDTAAGDPRVELHLNPTRLGMLGNTNRAWSLSRARFPEAEYWALGSDHDVWHPRWLERLSVALDARPQAVLAYPLTRRVNADGRPLRAAWRFDTEGIRDPRARLRRGLYRMVSGDMIYGLFRARALDRTGFYAPVLAPDRLLLSQLTLEGEFVQVPETLWDRRFVGLASLERQRRAFWPEGAPPRTRLPWWMAHSAAWARQHGVRSALADYVPASVAFQVRRRVLNTGSAVAAPAVRGALARPAVRAAVRRGALPALRETRVVLERMCEEAEADAANGGGSSHGGAR